MRPVSQAVAALAVMGAAYGAFTLMQEPSEPSYAPPARPQRRSAKAPPAKARASRGTSDSGAPSLADWLLTPPVPTKKWAAAGTGRHPAVLLLHGAGGPGFFTERPEYMRYPEALAAAGFVVAMPHYAESTDPPADTAKATLDWLAGEPDVDPMHLAVLGFSRGGFIGSCVAGTYPELGAFASLYGGVDARCRSRIHHMPPTLILHGEADPVVPLESATFLADFVRDHHGEVELHTYPGQEHVFLAGALDDSVARLIAFFGRHLRGPSR